MFMDVKITDTAITVLSKVGVVSVLGSGIFINDHELTPERIKAAGDMCSIRWNNDLPQPQGIYVHLMLDKSPAITFRYGDESLTVVVNGDNSCLLHSIVPHILPTTCFGEFDLIIKKLAVELEAHQYFQVV